MESTCPLASTTRWGMPSISIPWTSTCRGVIKRNERLEPSGMKKRVSLMPLSSIWITELRTGALARSRNEAAGPAPWSLLRPTL